MIGGQDALRRILEMVEGEAAAAGVTPAYAREVTSSVERVLPVGSTVYPVAVYYFIIREAALRHDSRLAAANLASALSTGQIVKLSDLPVKAPQATDDPDHPRR